MRQQATATSSANHQNRHPINQATLALPQVFPSRTKRHVERTQHSPDSNGGSLCEPCGRQFSHLATTRLQCNMKAGHAQKGLGLHMCHICVYSDAPGLAVCLFLPWRILYHELVNISHGKSTFGRELLYPDGQAIARSVCSIITWLTGCPQLYNVWTWPSHAGWVRCNL